MSLRTLRAAGSWLALAALGVACRGASVATDGYRGRLSLDVGQSVEVAARPDRTRVTLMGETHEVWITIRRLDLGKQWDYRPFGQHANKVIVSKLRKPTRQSYWDRIPPTPGFDAQKYAEQFEGSARLRDHLRFAGHDCDIFDVSFFKGGVDRIWVARDLGGLPVRIQHGTLVESYSPGVQSELRAERDYQLVRIDPGAPLSLFELPEGATLIPNPDE